MLTAGKYLLQVYSDWTFSTKYEKKNIPKDSLRDRKEWSSGWKSFPADMYTTNLEMLQADYSIGFQYRR